ncbi:selenocysteine insertion sequence-binding 2-like isoform X1 [Chlorella sorokiniana]|uniref:Selenocysteine insertion sequence-binding 2-like isoform X1 n=1 Tax=Chlorella sorokiniana TaxID=3076 RepID=A0A2P6TCU4_CHLSO|nr:selenocysteine insertion sequence-binding 2-like isoform X1 [Chlorella sorokiniana]|eukprot:PRW20470.1 selenocysteine insertion sequence-binding 2-like isoform X1 [Chlorella sorokiniana]
MPMAAVMLRLDQQQRQQQLPAPLACALKAAQACTRWQGVLAELEAALQAVGEASGALANQQAALQLQLAAAQQQAILQRQQAAGSDGVGSGGISDVEPYVNQVITAELNATAEALLRRLLEWQERVRQTDPANFKRKRRLVSGLREVEKAVKTRRAKLVLLAPNIAGIEEPEEAASAAAAAAAAEVDPDAEGEGAAAVAAGAASAADPAAAAAATAAAAAGSTDANGGGSSTESPAAALVALAREREVPLVFALSRQRMGKVLGQRKRASAFAVLDANGVFEELRALLGMAEQGRRQWVQHAQQALQTQQA